VRLVRGAVVTLVMALPAQAEPPDINALVVLPDRTVDGQTLPTYANLWWQWAFSMPDRESAIVDTVGTFCAAGQSGPVWFLAGGYGSSKIQRRCTIPADRHLFFPIINEVQNLFPAGAAYCEAIKAQAARNNDRFVYLKVLLDGVELSQPERFRIASTECFDPFARVPADAGAPRDAIAATDGYWVMLHPLPPGPHRLEFRAFYTNPDEALGDMVQNIAYDLTVMAD
jgi:hypothetical protein